MPADSLEIKYVWPRCECGHTYYDHNDDMICALAALDGCFAYWPDGLRVTRGEMIARYGAIPED